MYILEHEDQVLGLKSHLSQRVPWHDGAVAIAPKLLCVLDDNPVQGRTEVTVPGKCDLPKTIHFANESRRWDELQRLFRFPLVPDCVFLGFCCFQPSPPSMGMGAVEEEGCCGTSVGRLSLV